MMNSNIVKSVVLIFVTAILQISVIDRFSVSHVHGDIFPLVVIVASLIKGPEIGATVGLFTGLVEDLFLPTPYGLSSLVYVLLGYLIGMITIENRGKFYVIIVVAFGSAFSQVLWALLAILLQQPNIFNSHIASIVMVVTVINILVSLLYLRFASYVLTGSQKGWKTISTVVRDAEPLV